MRAFLDSQGYQVSFAFSDGSLCVLSPALRGAEFGEAHAGEQKT